MEMKTDREMDLAIYEREAKTQAAVKDGWTRIIGMGKAAYTKNGKYLDMLGNPCPAPEGVEVVEEKPKRKLNIRKERPQKVEKVEEFIQPEPPEAA